MGRLLHACAVLTALVIPAVARADIYTYTGADGTIHFTNTPGADKRYRIYIKGNGWEGKPGVAPGVVPVPPSDHDVGRYTRYDDWIREAATLYQIPIPSSGPSSGARATTTRAPSASREHAASCSSCPKRRP